LLNGRPNRAVGLTQNLAHLELHSALCSSITGVLGSWPLPTDSHSLAGRFGA